MSEEEVAGTRGADKGGGGGYCVGLGTREVSCDELLLWEERRMMGGLCQ